MTAKTISAVPIRNLPITMPRQELPDGFLDADARWDDDALPLA